MIPTKQFGRTQHASSRIIFGSYALSEATQEEADHVLDLLFQYGINHIDTAPMYGKAEERIGSWMAKHRKNFFLATKTRNRAYEATKDELQSSLNRLQVDTIDLWQMHGLTNPVGWEKAMSPGGTLEAFIEARDTGLVRFLGVTGHGKKVPEMHLRSLDRFDFDSVLLPYNYLEMKKKRYAENFNELVKLCAERNIALQTIKSVARRKWEGPRNYNTYFYEPLESQDTIDKAVHWSMSLTNSFLITAGDIKILPKILDAAKRYEKCPTDLEMDAMLEEFDISPIF